MYSIQCTYPVPLAPSGVTELLMLRFCHKIVYFDDASSFDNTSLLNANFWLDCMVGRRTGPMGHAVGIVRIMTERASCHRTDGQPLTQCAGLDGTFFDYSTLVLCTQYGTLFDCTVYTVGKLTISLQLYGKPYIHPTGHTNPPSERIPLLHLQSHTVHVHV